MKKSKHFYHRFLRILQDIRGEADPKLADEVRSFVINGVTYIVNVFYKKHSSYSAKDKVERLIDKALDAEN